MPLLPLVRLVAASLCAALLLNAAPARADELVAEPEAAQPKVRRGYVSPQLAASVNAKEAERSLEQAQKKRRLGMAPQAGESARTPNGIVVNSRYWNRQEKLRLEVESAQRRLNHLTRPQLATR